MQINELNLLQRAPVPEDVFPIDTGSSTHRVSFYVVANTVKSMTGMSQLSNDISAYQGQNVIVDSPSSVSVSNDTVTDLATITITAGLWLIIAGTGWSASAAGWRMIDISGERDKKSMVAPVTGDQTTQQVSFFRKTTTSTTITLKGRQTSGSTLTAYPYIKAVKIW